MFLDQDDAAFRRMNERSQRSRWFFYGVLAIVVLAPLAAWLVKRHNVEQTAPEPAVEQPASAASEPKPEKKPATDTSKPFVPEKTQAQSKTPEQKTVTAPPPPVTGQNQALLTRLRGLYSERRMQDARAMGYKILADVKDPTVVAETEKILGELNMKLLFSPENMPEKTEYTVQKGDSLDRIAKKFGTTIDLLRESNELKSDRINYGDRMRVFTGQCSLHVNKTRNDMELRVNGRFFKRYLVGTGKFGKTPGGSYLIEIKIKNPPWTRPADKKIIPFGDPENVLGTRWMSIKADEGTEPIDGYGIHGTIEPETVGKQSSDGCIRLINSEVEELYAIVPEGTQVTITE